MPAAGQSPASHVKSVSCTRWIECFDKVTIGSTGAISSQSADAPGFAATRSTTGTYTLTFPTGSDVKFDFSIYSPALTIMCVIVTALDAGAGTATIKTVATGGAAADPASGDVIGITIKVKP